MGILLGCSILKSKIGHHAGSIENANYRLIKGCQCVTFVIRSVIDVLWTTSRFVKCVDLWPHPHKFTNLLWLRSLSIPDLITKKNHVIIVTFHFELVSHLTNFLPTTKSVTGLRLKVSKVKVTVHSW